MHLNLTILQHKLGKAARRKQNPFQRSSWKWPVLRGSPTQHYTLHYTQHYRTAGTGNHFGALRLLRNEITSQFFCPDPKCCPWQRFGSVACSVAGSVACSVAWLLRVVCSVRVACGGCNVAYFASCLAAAVCRWRVKHIGGTMRRTNDGWSPGNSWWREEICKTKNTRIVFFFFGGWKKSCTTSITLHLRMHNLYPRTPNLNVEWHVNRWCRISVTRVSLCLQTILN